MPQRLKSFRSNTSGTDSGNSTPRQSGKRRETSPGIDNMDKSGLKLRIVVLRVRESSERESSPDADRFTGKKLGGKG